VEALPSTASSDDAKEKWFEFFQNYGTHYAKSIDFGGIMRMTTFISESSITDSNLASKSWQWALTAKYEQMAELGTNWNSSHTESEFQQVEKCMTDTNLIALGGDATLSDYNAWLKTVRKKPAPIKTMLGPIQDLIPIDKQATAQGALKAYISACPHTNEQGICNGYGSCDFHQHSCTCSSGTYKDTDGNCYLSCPQNCNGHGTCSKGKCQCQTHQVSGSDAGKAIKFGYYGRACQEKCGTGHWSIVGSFKNPDGNKIDESQMDCFCGQKTGLPVGDGMMKGFCNEPGGMKNCNTYQATANTYGCQEGGSRKCEWPGCDGLDHVSCRFGGGRNCDDDL
jgi:hypothetical protein